MNLRNDDTFKALETQRKLGYERGFMEALEKVQEPYAQLKNDDVVSVGLIRQNILDLKNQMQKGDKE